jgi:hypothetical protein
MGTHDRFDEIPELTKVGNQSFEFYFFTLPKIMIPLIKKNHVTVKKARLP